MREAHHAAHTVNYIVEGMLLSGEPELCLPLRHVVLKACKGWGWSKCFSLFSQQDLCIGVQGKLYWYGGMYSLILLYARLWGGNGRQTLVQPHMFVPNPVWYSRKKMLTAGLGLLHLYRKRRHIILIFRFIVLFWGYSQLSHTVPFCLKQCFTPCVFKVPLPNKQSPLIGQLTRLSHHR